LPKQNGAKIFARAFSALRGRRPASILGCLWIIALKRYGVGDEDSSIARRYEIQDAIGKGGSGSVFRAWDVQLGRYVAIKRINEDAEIEASIRQEAAILATLHHPNIVTVFDFDSDENGPFVVMELVNGRTLEVIAPEHPLTLTGFFELANQVCHGLSAAHSKGLIHRDLKPGNLMLHFHEDRSFTLKILDFGLAKHDQDTTEPDLESDSVVGSAYTIAPEQLLREPVDQRTDIYSLGVVFFFSLTGRYPYDGETIEEVIDAHLNKHPASLHLVREDVPEALSMVISKMLARDPDARPQSVEEVRIAVTAVARAPASKKPVPLPPGTVRSVKKSPVVFVVPVVAAVGIVAVVYFMRSTPAPAPVVVPIVAATPAGPAKVDPLDYTSLSQFKGDTVIAEGVITSLANDDLYATNDLKFSDTDMNALVIAFPKFKFHTDKVRAYVGKQVRVTGRISEVEGLYRIVMEPDSAIEIVKAP
jgi:serine/threonine protein kinase